MEIEMALGDSAIGEALNSLFPSKRYAPKKDVDSGCPTPPEGWDKDDDEDGDQ
jgi:hypothetical protein